MNEGQHIKSIERLVGSNNAVILNANFEVNNISHWHRAIELTLSDSAQIIVGNTKGQLVRSQHLTFPQPLIVALNRYVEVEKKVSSSPISEDCVVPKGTIFARDNYTCVYCGATNTRLNIDHIIPRSKGGKNTWSNMVASCLPCNSRKADKSIEEMGYKEPVIPVPSAEGMKLKFAVINRAVQRYLKEEYAQDYALACQNSTENGIVVAQSGSNAAFAAS